MTCPVQCPEFTSIANGIVSGSNSYGESTTFSCNTGYNLDGSSTLTCQSTGTWSGSPPTCEAGQCPTLTPPSNGDVQSDSNNLGAVATFTCNPGYNIVGDSTLTCQTDLSWSGSSPTCTVGQCPSLTPPSNGAVSGSNYLGRMVTFTCHSGYNLVGVSTLTCQTDLSWSGSSPTCTAVQCPVLTTPTNGDVSGGNSYGDVATFTCNSGYSLSGPATLTCQADATWGGASPTCQAGQCPSLTHPLNGDVSTGSNNLGDVATFTCHSGYDIVGGSTRTCQTDLSWSGSSPTCTAVQCPVLTSPSNGDMSGTNVYGGGPITFSCDTGYNLVGASTLTCQADGTWSGSQPTCEVLMRVLSSVVGVNVALGKPAFQTSTRTLGGAASRAVDGNTDGTFFAGSCSHTISDLGEYNPTWWVDLGQSYVIDRVVIFNRQDDCCWERINPFNIHIGDSDQVSTNPQCGGDHQVDVNQPSISVSCPGMQGRYVAVRLPGPYRVLTLCEVQIFPAVQCPELTSPTNGDMSGSNVYGGGPITFSCDTGYNLVGSSTLTCQADGTWSGSPPTCEALKKWRDDARCGPSFPAEDGNPAECDPDSIIPCCSPVDWCGNTAHHCECWNCIDYRNTAPKKWRDDARCGPSYPAEDGNPAECDPDSIIPCCSNADWCGNTANHCDCSTCIDYRNTGRTYTCCVRTASLLYSLYGARTLPVLARTGGESAA
ncbi:E-selectin-like [Branchiostoma floridae x Branchiostoma japonicum]